MGESGAEQSRLSLARKIREDDDLDIQALARISKDIEIVRITQQTPDQPKIAGRLGALILTKRWAYWVVDGPVPKEVAVTLDRDEENQSKIRANGHNGHGPIGWQDSNGFTHTYHIDTLSALEAFVARYSEYLKENPLKPLTSKE